MTRAATFALTCSALAALAGGCGRTQVWQLDVPPSQENCSNGIDDDGDSLVDCKDPDCAVDPRCKGQYELCTNGIDDDGDLLVDCRDPDCATDPSCKGKTETICDNGIDDDSDGWTDCQDPDCRNAPNCQIYPPEICDNGIDDDYDGLTDCKDPDCFAAPGCKQKKEICTNSIDDDGDTLIDCKDPDCAADPSCKGKVELCDNNADDDGDGLVDCKDPDCWANPICSGKQEVCDNGVDDDGDTQIDCEDSDCKAAPSCQVKQEICTNNVDDDGDSLVDCKDPDCLKHPTCKQPGKEICNNAIDDDEDSLVDCKDPDCQSEPYCKPGKELCDNNIDDDGDGAVDCADPDCATFAGCITELCKPTVDFGTINPKGSSSTKTVITTGTKDYYTTPCAIPGGGEVVARFELTGKTDLKLEYDQTGDHVFGVFRAGLAEACNANPKGCYDPQSAKTGSFGIKSLDPGVYFLIVEGFAKGLEGTVKITLSTGPVTSKEICANGIDDDGDSAIDCADLDCFLDPLCTTQNCTYDVNLGMLVVDGPSKSANVNTGTAKNNYDEICGGGGAGDRIIRFVMPQAAGLRVDVEQQGWHVLGLHHDLGPGTKCNADTGSCFDTNQTAAFALVYDAVEKGVHYYIVDALKKGMEGYVNLTFRAVSNRGPELCANGIDDDADGMLDCMDPDCIGFPGCAGPPCQPDMEAGSLSPNGPSTSLKLDLTKGVTGEIVPCALGGGKGLVVGLTLTQVSGLEIDCTQTGDHVFGLFSAVQPRDPCDKNAVNCADPKIGLLGCNFIMPNLQPGTYYLVVQAFKPGAEGTMSLTLSATPDHAQEICNNNIDDDGNGLTDCKDPSCAQHPICMGAYCVIPPDNKLGLIPATGTAVPAAVTTMGAGDRYSTSCAKGGGEDEAISFKLAAGANLQVDFAQFGNHVFGLFDNKGTAYACDAGPKACQATNGQVTGKVLFTGLQAGEYYLIVEAVSAGSEGSVVMKLSAK